MAIGLVGKKLGMTQRFFENGESLPVTVLKIEKAKVVDVINKEKRGYSAVLVGYGHIKNSKLTKQMKGFFAKKSQEPKKILKEFRLENTDELKPGTEINLDVLKDKKYVDVRAKTIGKGFAGSMKRHNFGGMRATHGVSISFSTPGMNSLGIAPPLIRLSTSLPLPGSCGSTTNFTLANCPEPPDCFLCV